MEPVKKLVLDDRKIPDPFKIPHVWQNEKEGMIFWPIIIYPDSFGYLVLNLSEFGIKDLGNCKSCKTYSCFKSDWLQPLMYHNLSGSEFCIFKREFRHSQAINNLFHKFWLIYAFVGSNPVHGNIFLLPGKKFLQLRQVHAKSGSTNDSAEQKK